jgi:hypothetical protein
MSAEALHPTIDDVTRATEFEGNFRRGLSANGPPFCAGGSFFAAVKLCRHPSLCLRQGACSLVGAGESFLAPGLQELSQPPAQISGSLKNGGWFARRERQHLAPSRPSTEFARR